MTTKKALFKDSRKSVLRGITISLVCLTFLTSFFLTTPKAEAFSFGDIINGIKNVFTSQSTPSQNEFTVTSKIELAPGGDLNNNGQIDAGDTLRFSYTITNTTDTTYKFATLKTNINRNDINFIHNIQGALSLNDNGKTVTIPNLHVFPQQTLATSFDARIDYNSSTDQVIKTQPEFITSDNKTVYKEQQEKQITAKKLGIDKEWSIVKVHIKQ